MKQIKWKNIDFNSTISDKYIFSEFGEIRRKAYSVNRHSGEMFIKETAVKKMDNRGEYYVSILNPETGKHKIRHLSHLIYEAFTGNIFDFKRFDISYKDGNYLNVSFSNLVRTRKSRTSLPRDTYKNIIAKFDMDQRKYRRPTKSKRELHFDDLADARRNGFNATSIKSHIYDGKPYRGYIWSLSSPEETNIPLTLEEHLKQRKKTDR